MKRNPVMPYALIAVLGLTLMIVISFVGLNQMDQVKGDHGGEKKEEEAATTDPEKIYSQNCASCHGSDLSGQVGPSLKTIGSKYSKEEIQGIIEDGKGSAMPAFKGKLKSEQIKSLTNWLSEKK
ncbi:cytochrome c550 [Pontibacillus marinus]|uniref:Cytochrome C551 n=1 Tax=Pontibacillus marinus BH030004 = DSM 16465 TaxID=1385511 RepID=A0A0A5G2E7_9BACI|nr:cytochrome c [Pontibacillus marinus]KGX85323.1 cytochrome C551 [Pontibacillus marinus BH030004 = DSM 16465]